MIREEQGTANTPTAWVDSDGWVDGIAAVKKHLENGTKYDQEKPRMELLDAEWLEEVAWVMTDGAKKYNDNNWRGGLAITRLLGAALRHLFAVLRGEDNDPETGRSHLAHLSCCAQFAYWTLKHKSELDDRYKTKSMP